MSQHLLVALSETEAREIAENAVRDGIEAFYGDSRECNLKRHSSCILIKPTIDAIVKHMREHGVVADGD